MTRMPHHSFGPFLSAIAVAVTTLACAAAPATDGSVGPGGFGADSGTDTAFGSCGAPYTPAWAIQGDGPRTPLEGRVVVVEGVVVGDYEGPLPALRGFYLQDPLGDDEPATSDAVFIFNGDRDDVRLGDRVRVRGTAEEIAGQTQLSRAGSLEICDRGRTVDPVDVTLPFPSQDWPERLEGMLVRFPGTLHVTDPYLLGRFGAVSLSSGGRLPQPTDVAEPGPAARAVRAANDRNRIVVDDARNDQNPNPIPFARGGAPLTAGNTLRGGDRVAGLVGVLTWGAAGPGASGPAWRVRPLHALGGGPPPFVPANPRTDRVVVDGSTRVGSFNLLNYFDTFSGCTGGRGGEPVECRGADHAEEFHRQWRKIVAAILGMEVDVLGIVEMENDGYGPESAIAHLTERLSAAGSEPWRFVDVDSATGITNALGTDAIKVGFLYRADRVRPVGATAVLATQEFVTGGDPAPRNRPSLAQAFETLGREAPGRLVVSINHLKSKGSPCEEPAADDGQGNCNGVRVTAARALAAWLASDPTGTGDPDVLILGDLNAYAREDPVHALTSAGYTDLLTSPSYSYVFAGQWGRLDHALASPALASKVAGATIWHINADEPPVLGYDTDFKGDEQRATLYAPDPYRSSDHDPIVVGLDLERE